MSGATAESPHPNLHLTEFECCFVLKFQASPPRPHGFNAVLWNVTPWIKHWYSAVESWLMIKRVRVSWSDLLRGFAIFRKFRDMGKSLSYFWKCKDRIWVFPTEPFQQRALLKKNRNISLKKKKNGNLGVTLILLKGLVNCIELRNQFWKTLETEFLDFRMIILSVWEFLTGLKKDMA